MVLADSYRVSRAPHYSGYYYGIIFYGYRVITFYDSAFHTDSPWIL